METIHQLTVDMIEDAGYVFSKKYNAAFISKQGIDLGVYFKFEENELSLNSFDVYNSQILEFCLDISGLKIVKNPVRRVTIGVSSQIFFVSNKFESIEVSKSKKNIKNHLDNTFHQFHSKVYDLEILEKIALEALNEIKTEKRIWQSGVYEILSHISIIKQDISSALQYCVEYHHFRHSHPVELWPSIMRDTLIFINSKLNRPAFSLD